MGGIPIFVIVILCGSTLLLVAAIVTGAFILAAGKSASGHFSYLILLGAKVTGTEPSPILRDRIDTAATYLAAHTDVVCIVSGGKANEERISEAQCMFERLVAQGIAPHRLWLEDQAVNTRQNLRYSMALIEKRTGVRPDCVGILSSDTHLLRARLMARRQGITAVTIAAPSAHRSSFLKHFLREIFVIWYYTLTGF